jgi:hypothetical protein
MIRCEYVEKRRLETTNYGFINLLRLLFLCGHYCYSLFAFRLLPLSVKGTIKTKKDGYAPILTRRPNFRAVQVHLSILS